MISTFRHSCTRGVFGLKSWDAPRRPKHFIDEVEDQDSNASGAKSALSSSSSASTSTPSKSSSDSDSSSPLKIPNAKPGQKLVAKYSYSAQVDSPLGDKELSVKQGDKLVFKSAHKDTSHWWWVETEEGSSAGYVPSSYMFPIEEKLTGLPWLQNRPVESVPPVNTGSYKPYVSAYNKSSQNNSSSAPVDNYNCEVCNRTFNGPIPYQVHMKSKAHREEMEAASHN